MLTLVIPVQLFSSIGHCDGRPVHKPMERPAPVVWNFSFEACCVLEKWL